MTDEGFEGNRSAYWRREYREAAAMLDEAYEVIDAQAEIIEAMNLRLLKLEHRAGSSAQPRPSDDASFPVSVPELTAALVLGGVAEAGQLS